MEVAHGVIVVFLGGVTLLLEELKLAIPQSKLTVVGVGQVLVLAVQLRVLSLLLFKLLLDIGLVSIQSESELLVSLLKSEQVCLVSLGRLLVLALEGVAFLGEHRPLPIKLGSQTGQISLDVFESFAFQVVFGLDRLLLSCDTRHLVLRVSYQLFSLRS